MHVNLSSAERRLVESGIKARLKDSMSAQFSNLTGVAPVGSDVISVCGLVNAKNSFDGYAGDQIFYGLLLRLPNGSIDFSDAMISIGDSAAATMAAKNSRPG